MKRIQEAALLAEIAGGVGVILSLVFVGLQVRDNSRLLAAQAVLELRESNSLMARDLIGNAELSDIVHRGYADYEALTDLERWRFEFWVIEVLTHRMTAWKYAQEGLIDAKEVESWEEVTCSYLALPAVRAVWDKGDSWLREDFRAEIDQVCASKPGIDVPGPFRR